MNLATEDFARLCCALFLQPNDLMSIMQIYCCDDSGTSPQNRIVVVAGYLAKVVEWRRFQDDWALMLKTYRIKQIHRADLESLKGEFIGRVPSDRLKLVRAIHSIIKRRTKVAVGAAVIKADFDEAAPEWARIIFGNAYGWCVFSCLGIVRQWCEARGYKHPINWVFETGTKGTTRVAAVFSRLCRSSQEMEYYRIGGYSFSPKSLLPLQAADTIAYEIFKHVENQVVDSGKRPVRLSMHDLMRPADEPYLKLWNREALRFCDARLSPELREAILRSKQRKT
jgi:hypothetical protein